jgi:diguanylate cyclase (GGDEF)-like protein
VCRRSGDEFLILLGEIEMPDDTKQVSKQILTAIAEPLTINDNEIMLAASIGISIYPDDGTDATKLTECADRAMYHAKKSGKNNFYYSEPHNLSGEVES